MLVSFMLFHLQFSGWMDDLNPAIQTWFLQGISAVMTVKRLMRQLSSSLEASVHPTTGI